MPSCKCLLASVRLKVTSILLKVWCRKCLFKSFFMNFAISSQVWHIYTDFNYLNQKYIHLDQKNFNRQWICTTDKMSTSSKGVHYCQTNQPCIVTMSWDDMCVISSAIFSYSLGPLGSSKKVTNFFDQVLLVSYLLWTSPCLYPLQIQVCESVWIRNLNSCGHFDPHLCHIYQTGGGRGYLKELQSIYMYRLIRYR